MSKSFCSKIVPRTSAKRRLRGASRSPWLFLANWEQARRIEGKGEEKTILKNIKPAPAGGNFTIQANAFKECAKLATLVLPELKGKDSDNKLVIEKDAFCGCGALRTVVALCDKAEFTGNPFASSPEHLTFVCKKDSDVARFARENGYRSVYVEQSV